MKNLKTGDTAIIDPTDEGKSIAVQSDDQKRLRALVDRRHPKYEEALPHWQFLEATYDGGREWFQGNIFRYVKEGDTEFADRMSRCYRFNHSREVVDLINKYLFRQNITRNEDAPESVRQFWKRATLGGLDVTEFMRHVSRRTSTVGRVAIVVDSNFSGAIISKADLKQSKAQVYAYIVGPESLLDYSLDAAGELNWALLREYKRDDEDPLNSSGEVIERFRLWDRKSWRLFEEQTESRSRKKIVMIDSGEHNLGRVPVILANHVVTDEEYTSRSMIDDIAYLDRAAANYLSNLDAIIQDQTFSQLAMPAQNVLPGEDAYNKMVEMGTKRVFLYDGEGGGQPFYLSPDVKQAQLIVTVVNKIIGEIYHTVGLAGERTKQDNAVGIDNSSGVAKAYDFERVNALLAAKADSLEVVENKLVSLVAAWHGEEKSIKADLVSYPDDFDTRGLYDEFDIAARLMLIDAPDQVRRSQMEMVVDKLFPQLKEDLRKKMADELSDWPVDPVEEMARLSEAKGAAAGNAPTPAGGAGEKPKADKRQGQVTKETK